MIQRFAITLLINLFFLSLLSAQETFLKNFGGKNDEYVSATIQTSRGDYIMVGPTNSEGAGSSDIWVSKIDPSGREIWKKVFGGKGSDIPHDLVETSDGHYTIAGSTQNKAGGKNALVFKVSNRGRMMWYRTFGGEKRDEARSIIQTSDGGFAVCGNTRSYAVAEIDIWVLRLDREGKQIWEQAVHSQQEEMGRSIVQTQDEGFVVVGYRDISDKVAGDNKDADMVILKLDKEGNGMWRKKLWGTNGNDVAEKVHETEEGDLMIAGWTHSPETRSMDGILLKVDYRGEPIWKRTYGRSGKDLIYDFTPVPGGGYALVGETSIDRRENSDLWLLKVDEKGRTEWEQRLGGEKAEIGFSVAPTRDRGFIVGGLTKSFTNGGRDMWLAKTNRRGDTEPMNPLLALNKSPDDRGLGNSSSNPMKPDLYILSIGISRYNDPTVNLTFAHTDAEAVANRFTVLEGSIYGNVEIRTVLNEEATLRNIKMGISWLEREATQHDVIMMFISSHGALDHKGNLYILPTDFNSYNLFATALNIRDITEGINGVPCKKLIFLDACHSGQSGFDLVDMAYVKAVNVNRIVEDVMNKEPGITVMTSSSGKEYSYENPKWGHGAFTKAILEGLDGPADIDGDMVISINELNMFVSKRVKQLTGGRQHPRTPINLFGDLPLFLVE